MKSRTSTTSKDFISSPARLVDLAQRADALELPRLSSLDTGSFVNLFDRFARPDYANGNRDAANAKDFAWPAVSTPPLMGKPTGVGPSANMLLPRKSLPVRNDSTGSSSVASSRQTSSTPTITRHSSCSSVEDKSPTPPPKDDGPSKVTALPRVIAQDMANATRQRSRTGTVDSANSSTPNTPNVDKPLPTHPRSPRSPRLDITKAFNFSRPRPTGDGMSCLPGRSPFTYHPTHHRRSATINLGSPLPQQTNAKAADERPKLRLRAHSATVAELPGSLPDIAPLPLAPKRKKATHASIGMYQITARTAEDVIYRIMAQLSRPEDLRAAALVSKGFLNTFQRNESRLVSKMMFKASRPAWETRRSIIVLRASTDFTLSDYQRDIRTLRALKSFILTNCLSHCRPKTLAGLAGNDKEAEAEVDSALWRIWTFCALFGENAAHDDVSPAQVDWLNGSTGTKSEKMGAGFAVGNGAGLSSKEMEDMAELWQCLRLLLSRFRNRHPEALRAGVLDQWNPSDGTIEEEFISEWISYLCTLGPQIVLALSGASFEKAKFLGLTKWMMPPPVHTRSTFLSNAISQVYQERLISEASLHAAPLPFPRQSRHRHSRSVDEGRPGNAMQRHVLRLDTQAANRQRPVSTHFSSRPEGSIKPDCDPNSAISHRRQVSNPVFPASPTADPTFFHTLAMNRAVSTRLGATLFPVEYPTSSRPKLPLLLEEPRSAEDESFAIIDPIDKALDLLVRQMGFNEANAKRALAMTDTGSGIDVERAMELLNTSRPPRAINTVPIELPTPDDIVAPLRPLRKATSDEHCDGTCRSNSIHKHSPASLSRQESNLRRNHTRSSSMGHFQSTPDRDDTGIPTSPITDIYGGHSAANSVSSLDWQREASSGDAASALATLTNSPQTHKSGRPQSKAWRVLGVAQQKQQSPRQSPFSPQDMSPLGQKALPLPGGLQRARSKLSKPKSNVVGMDEYLERIERRRSQRVVQESWKVQSSSGAGDVFGVPPPTAVSSAGPAGPGQFRTVVPGNNAGLGGLRPVVAIDTTVKSTGRSSRQSRRYYGEDDVEEEEDSSPGRHVMMSGGLDKSKTWKNVMGTVKVVGGVGHYKNSKREKQVAKEMLTGGGERAFVG